MSFELRAKNRLVEAEKIGVQGLNALRELYFRSLRSINKQIEKLYSRYSDETGLAVNELAQIIKGTEYKQHIVQLNELLAMAGVNNGGQLYNPAVYSQITRLNAIKEEIYWKLKIEVNAEMDIHTKTYREIIDNVYNWTAGDLQRMGLSVGTLNERTISIILRERWSGANYSERIWRNNDKFARQVSYIIGEKMITGESFVKTARIIKDRYRVRDYEARRLVRTETNYIANQSSYEVYSDAGVKKYQYYALLDGKQSKVCEGLHRKVFEIEEAVIGENYPPMHPNCRSTILPIVDSMK